MERLHLVVVFLLSNLILLHAQDDIDNHLIDLGLPSGTLWLDHNLGATNNYDFGEYYLGNEDNFLEASLGLGFSTPTKDQFKELIDNTTHYWGEVSGVKGMIFSASNGNSIFLPAAAQLWFNEEEGDGFWDINNEGSGAYWTCTPSDYENYIYFVEFNDEEGNQAFFGDRNKLRNRLPVRPVFYNPISCSVYRSPENRHKGEAAKGFCADGWSELKITYESKNYKLDNFVNLKFYISDKLVEENFSGSIQNIEYFTDSINIILQAPTDFLANGPTYDVDLVITPSASGRELKPEHFKYSVFRPGVLFFHGLGDNSSLFDIMKESIIENETHLSDQLLAIDYSSSNTSSFEANTHINHVVKNGCHKLQDIIFDEFGIICSRFDMVGHSMGGILIRLFVQEDQGYSYTNKILTLNTPHFGSELGNIAIWADNLSANIQNISYPNDSEKNYTFIHNQLRKWLFKEDDSLDALKDLSISSDAIVNLNGSSANNICGIPVHAICSAIPDMNNGSFARSSPFILPQLLLGIIKRSMDSFIGDGVVPLYSQQGGLNHNSTVYSGDIFNAFHCNSPKWENFICRVSILLNESKDSDLFSLNGFKKPDARSLEQLFSREAIGDYLEDFNPIDYNKSSISLTGAVLSNNDKEVNLTINKSEDINYLFVFGLTDNKEILYNINSVDNYFDLSNYDYNEITFYAVGKTDYNAILIDSISIDKELNFSSINTIKEFGNDFVISTIGNSITIKSKQTSAFEIYLFDATGQLIKDKKTDSEITFDELIKGIYFLNVVCKGKKQTYKILI